jgi:hypothetical protein
MPKNDRKIKQMKTHLASAFEGLHRFNPVADRELNGIEVITEENSVFIWTHGDGIMTSSRYKEIHSSIIDSGYDGVIDVFYSSDAQKRIEQGNLSSLELESIKSRKHPSLDPKCALTPNRIHYFLPGIPNQPSLILSVKRERDNREWNYIEKGTKLDVICMELSNPFRGGSAYSLYSKDVVKYDFHLVPSGPVQESSETFSSYHDGRLIENVVRKISPVNIQRELAFTA